MKTKSVASALLSISLLSASLPAMADWDGGRHGDHGRWERDDYARDRDWRSDNRQSWNRDWDRNEQHGWRDNDRWRDNHWHDNGWHGRNDGWNNRVVVVQRDYVRGAPRPYYEWRRGQYLPVVYRQRNYYVDDWRSYRLYEPPRGYRWVNVNGDYILVSVVSNVIAHILLGH